MEQLTREEREIVKAFEAVTLQSPPSVGARPIAFAGRSGSVAVSATGEEALEYAFQLGHALAKFGHVLGQGVDTAAQIATQLADVVPQPGEEGDQERRREPRPDAVHCLNLAGSFSGHFL